jgi:hypothetical protein
MVCRYNLGKVNTNVTTTTTVYTPPVTTVNYASSYAPRTFGNVPCTSGYAPNHNSSSSVIASDNSPGNSGQAFGRRDRPGKFYANRQQNKFCRYCWKAMHHYKANCHHYEANCRHRKKDIRNGIYKNGDNSERNDGNNQGGANRSRGDARSNRYQGKAFTSHESRKVEGREPWAKPKVKLKVVSSNAFGIEDFNALPEY